MELIEVLKVWWPLALAIIGWAVAHGILVTKVAANKDDIEEVKKKSNSIGNHEIKYYQWNNRSNEPINLYSGIY